MRGSLPVCEFAGLLGGGAAQAEEAAQGLDHAEVAVYVDQAINSRAVPMRP